MPYIRIFHLIFLISLVDYVYAQEHIINSIVKIYADYNTPDYYQPWRMHGKKSRIGSGFIIDKQRIVTNAHIIGDHSFIRVRRAGKAEKYTAQVAYIGHDVDLAILTVADTTFFSGSIPLAFGTFSDVGETVLSYGFPAGGTRITITRGIISRIDRKVYRHSLLPNLIGQIDAAINPGSSGGPIISQNRVVGVAFQSGGGSNIGYMVPVPVITQFFKDIEDRTYVGVPGLPISWQNLENDNQRKHYKMEHTQTGVLVTQVFPGLIANKKLQIEDVILSVDGYPVANDGTIELRKGTRISFLHLIDRRQKNDEVEVTILRHGKIIKKSIILNTPARECQSAIPLPSYECQPRYYIHGGLVFSPLTTNLLREWGSKWQQKAPRDMVYYFFKNPNSTIKEIIVLIQILSDEMNVGYKGAVFSIIDEINGKKITGMRNLIKAFDNPKNNIHTILTQDNRYVINIPIDQNKVINQKILKKYKIERDRSEDLRQIMQ